MSFYVMNNTVSVLSKCETDHSPPSSSEVEMSGALHPFHHTSSWCGAYTERKTFLSVLCRLLTFLVQNVLSFFCCLDLQRTLSSSRLCSSKIHIPPSSELPFPSPQLEGHSCQSSVIAVNKDSIYVFLFLSGARIAVV